MKQYLLLISLLIQSCCIQSENTINSIEVGDDLRPHMNQQIQIIAKVSNTKYPSFGNGWITCWQLEDYRGKKVKVIGTITDNIETTQTEDGLINQGRDGTYYYLMNPTIEIMK